MDRKIFLMAVCLLSLMVLPGARAQEIEWSQQQACTGWNNPSNFTVGSGVNKYSGAGITVSSGKPCPNPLQAVENQSQLLQSLGVSGMPVNYTASQLSGVGASASCSATSASSTSLPNRSRQFFIMNDTVGRDPNTGGRLPYVPTHFNTHDSTSGAVNTHLTRSIRIGDACANGGAAGGAMLNYTMRVTTDNAMMYIYYAIVAEAPTHGEQGNPTFVIRVCKKSPTGLWKQINDTLTYYISSTSCDSYTSSSTDCPNIDCIEPEDSFDSVGWHIVGSGYSEVLYKDWEKVAINLSDFLYDTVQVSVLIYDCVANYHYAYAYICGECRPMLIQTNGCPPGISTDVGTITAPANLRNYVWYASEWGVAEPPTGFAPGLDHGHFTWRQLTPDVSTGDNPNVYHVQANDFRVTRRHNAYGQVEVVDSIGNWQTFRCKMTSALDPAKPFSSYLYVNMQNKKPSMLVDSLYTCDGKVKLWNRSKVPGDPSITNLSMTRWTFHNNANGQGDTLQMLVGDSMETVFNDSDIKSVRVRTFTTDPTCYSEAIYPFHPRQNPKAGMTLSAHVLCDADETTILDTTSGDNNSRVWRFRPANGDNDDMTLSDTVTGRGNENKSITRSFTHALEPIELTVYNGTYYYDSVTMPDTMWCQTTVYDTVSLFLHPELEVLGDTVVCEGSQTDATVRAIGVEGCTYQWSLTYGTITGDLPAGPRLRVTPYADKSTYFVKVTSPQGCVAWDSIHAYMVRPKLSMLPEDGRICPGDQATLTGSEADHYSWSSSPFDSTLVGQESATSITVSPSVTTVYTMVGHGSNNCDATPLRKTVTIVPLPVPRVNTNPAFIDTDKPSVVLRDESTYGVNASWVFHDGTHAVGKEVRHEFLNCEGYDSVPVELTSFNVLNCPTVYNFSLPVNIFTAWFPNAFTPGSNDGNDIFSIHTINEYEFFHIYIYNRRGALVYESDDVHFRWDGTCDGEPCQQGSYVYLVRFRKPGTTTLSSIQGTVTLIR